MIQLKIVSGKKAGAVMVARRFPVRVGRMSPAEIQLEEAGIWDEHLVINFEPRLGFVLSPHPDAIVGINGQHIQGATILRNGDLIQVGSAQVQFWLGEVHQRSQRMRESFVWTMIAVVSLGQVALVYWLMAD